MHPGRPPLHDSEDGQLPRRQLGNTDLHLSVLGLGTVKFGRTENVKYPTAFELPNDEALTRLLQQAIDLGINYLDTAPAYGQSEERLGKLLGPMRDSFVLSTKVGEYFVDGESHYDFSQQATIASVERSLRKLRTGHLDIVFVHSNGEDAEIIQRSPIIETLSRLKEKGDIGAIGFSGKDAAESALALNQVDAFMIALNQHDTSQDSLLKLCETNHKGVVIKKALASGHVTDPHGALRFAAGYSGVTSVVVGSITPHHLQDNVAALATASASHDR